MDQKTKNYLAFYGSIVGVACVFIQFLYIFLADRIIVIDHVIMPVTRLIVFLTYVLLLVISSVAFIRIIFKRWKEVIW